MNKSIPMLQNGFINITVNEAWNYCSSTSNGIQIPIDVRNDGEWLSERIDTPFPEYPRHVALSLLQNNTFLQTFLDEYDGKNIIVYCFGGSRSATAAQLLVDHMFNGTIYNMLGGITAWKSADLPYKIGNIKPNQPLQPVGPTLCSSNVLYTYETRSFDQNTDVLRYGWDWNNDGTIDIWSEYMNSNETAYASHLWETSGQYHISVIAEDIVGSQSDYSKPLIILVNSPPSTPIVHGPTKGPINKEQTYSLTCIDPEGNNVSYFIDWDDYSIDEWIGPYCSETPVDVSHTWTEKNTYVIKVKAKDEWGAETDWETLEVSMAKSLRIYTGFTTLDFFLVYHNLEGRIFSKVQII